MTDDTDELLPRKAAVFIDGWKLPIFKQHLDRAGYEYEVKPSGFTIDGLLIVVVFPYNKTEHFSSVVVAAHTECAQSQGAKDD